MFSSSEYPEIELKCVHTFASEAARFWTCAIFCSLFYLYSYWRIGIVKGRMLTTYGDERLVIEACICCKSWNWNKININITKHVRIYMYLIRYHSISPVAYNNWIFKTDISKSRSWYLEYFSANVNNIDDSYPAHSIHCVASILHVDIIETIANL